MNNNTVELREEKLQNRLAELLGAISEAKEGTKEFEELKAEYEACEAEIAELPERR